MSVALRTEGDNMHDKLIGYLLDALEADEVQAIEQMLQTDAEARQQLEILRLGLAPLHGDSQDEAPPAGLAVRTCERIRGLHISSSPTPQSK
jgi:anti-sigma-K factor RskA